MSGPVFQANVGGKLRWGGREARCALGRGGVLTPADKRESDGATPLGAWEMRRVFYRSDRIARPETRIPVSVITREMGWCDDPMHPEYNRQVRLPFDGRHEVLWREDHVYDLVVELGFNDDPVVPGRGSAIFLHVAREDYSPTEGCVACALPDLLDMLKAVKPGDRLTIVR
jgi:L,D-peptidoglycan transpeptidase YkuD (ErfK/YbiS/YcfS/YnhG family)